MCPAAMVPMVTGEMPQGPQGPGARKPSSRARAATDARHEDERLGESYGRPKRQREKRRGVEREDS